MTQFNSEANYLDLYSDARWWCGIDNTDTTTYPLIEFTRNANFALDTVTSLIFRSDATWDWDDFNNTTDSPIALTTLVANQEDYTIAVTHLKHKRVRVKDAQGNYHVLTAVNRRDLSDNELNATAGLPKRYWQVGNSIFLNPKPSASAVTTSEGLEVQFQRGASYFTTSDTTKTPGFATQFHRLISLYAALEYCERNDLDKRAAKIRAKIETLENELVEFYSTRDVDQGARLTIARDDYGESSLDTFNANPNGF